MIENEQIIKNGKLAIVTGATGKTGYHITKRLIDRGYTVRIITRNQLNAKNVFGDLMKQMEAPLICDLAAEAKALERKIKTNTLNNSFTEFAFKDGSNGEKPYLVVSCQTKNNKTKEKCKYVDYYATRLLVILSQKYQVQKFGFISIDEVNYPNTISTKIKNILYDNIVYWKYLTENNIKNSGLPYVILRTGKLTGDQNSQQIHQVLINQNQMQVNNVQPISRKSVAFNLIDVMEDNQVPDKLTYQLFTDKELKKLPYCYQNQQLKQDIKEEYLELQNQIEAKQQFNYGIFVILILTILILNYLYSF